jgi:hypothetical protein
MSNKYPPIKCEGCGTTIYGGQYCSFCKMKMDMWTTILAMVLGCKRSEVRIKQKEHLEKKKNG